MIYGIRKDFLFCAILTIVVLSVFYPSLDNGFVEWDDDLFLRDNVLIKSISLKNIGRMFSSFHSGLYKPILMLVYAVEYHFFQLNPFIYHFNNLLLHMINVVIVFYLVQKISNDSIVSFLTALLFGIHPMHVESVAWVSDRKDLLSTFFILAALASYLRYIDKRNSGAYLKVAFLFICSLLVKPTGVTFPFLLFALDYLKNRRIDKNAIFEKIPLLCLAAVMIMVSVYGVSSVLRSNISVNFPGNIIYAAYTIYFYINKLFLPVNLSCYYGYPSSFVDLGLPAVIMSIVVLTGLVSMVIIKFKKDRHMVFGILFFFITLLPVMQIVKSGRSVVNDRYTYLSYIGLFIIISRVIVNIFNRYSKFRMILAPILLVWILTLGLLSNQRIEVWSDSLSLWEDAHMKRPMEYIPYLNKGVAYYKKGMLKEAMQDFKRAMLLDNNNVLVHTNLGVLYCRMKEYEKGIFHLKRAISINPDHADAYYNLGSAYYGQGKLDLAMSNYTIAIEKNPFKIKAFIDRGTIFGIQGKVDDAIRDFTKVIEFDPYRYIGYHNRGLAYYRKGLYQKAIKDFDKVIEMDPSFYPAKEMRRRSVEKVSVERL